MASVEIRYATQDDIAAFYQLPIAFRSKIWAGWDGDTLLGVGGFSFLPDGTLYIFMELDKNARKYRIALHRVGKFVVKDARQMGFKKIIAVANLEIEAAPRWLKSLGFTPVVDNEIWVLT